MTRPLDDVYARARLIWAEAVRRDKAGEPTTYPRDEVLEARIDHIATNWDETTRTYQPPLRNPRRTR